MMTTLKTMLRFTSEMHFIGAGFTPLHSLLKALVLQTDAVK